MKIYLDDLRNAPDDSWTEIKSSKEAIELIQSGVVEEISLDYDLGFTKESGMDVLQWLYGKAKSGDFTIRYPKIKIHSDNFYHFTNMITIVREIDRLLIK